jgi:hypothetical protein
MAHKEDARLPEALRTNVKLALNPGTKMSEERG